MFREIKNKINFFTRHNYLLRRYIAEVEAADRMTENEIRIRTEELFNDLINTSMDKSPFYRDLYSKSHLENPFANYSHLPIIDKKTVRENTDKILTLPKYFYKTGYTSGTSGSPLTVYRTPKSIIKENAYLWYYRNKHGLQIGDKVVSLRGVLDHTQLSYYNKAENILYLSSYLLSPENANSYFSLLNDFKPKAIWAYPSSVYTLANLLQKAGVKISIPLIFTSSETLYEYQKRKIEDFFGAKVYDWYGNAERTIAIGQCEYGHYHEMPLYSLNEYRGNGVITTSFINTSFPLIKYFVNDIIKKEIEPCACGKTHVIRTIEGRVDDVIELKDGTQIGRMDLAFKGVDNIEYSQIIQRQTDSVVVNLVTHPDFNENDKNLLLKNLKNRLGDSIDIRLNYVDESAIIKTGTGKFKLVISDIKASI